MKAPNNWINDPNGFIYFKGQYHMFYQYFPYAPRWGTMHWGHAVSPDLVHWEHKGIALFPSIWADRNGCFSGSAVEHEGRMHIAYTGIRYLETDPKNIHVSLNEQFEPTQMMISSEDGFTFDQWNGKRAVVPPVEDEAIGHRIHTRDPKLWRGKKGWYMILGSSLRGEQGEALLYRSDDLNDWQYAGKVMNDALPGWGWECPDYFETAGGGVLLFSAMGLEQPDGSKVHQALCCTAAFDEDGCKMTLADEYQFLDYGKDLYAPQSTLDAEGRRTVIAWLRMPRPSEDGWIGMFSTPRVVERKGDRICFSLHPAIRQAFSKPIERASQAGAGGYLIRAALRDGEELTLGGYRIFRENGCVCADRTALGLDPASCEPVSRTPAVAHDEVEILVDRNMIEIYAGGAYVITHAVYGMDAHEPKATAAVQLFAAE